MHKHPEHKPPGDPLERQISAALNRYTDSLTQTGKVLLLLKARDPAGFEERLKRLGMSHMRAEELMSATALAYGLARAPANPPT